MSVLKFDSSRIALHSFSNFSILYVFQVNRVKNKKKNDLIVLILYLLSLKINGVYNATQIAEKYVFFSLRSNAFITFDYLLF